MATVMITKDAQAKILGFCKEATKSTPLRETLRSRFREIDKITARELDTSTDTRMTKLHNLSGDPTKFRNIIAPVISPKIENAVTYQASVFLTGSPMMEVLGEPGSAEAAEQVTALLEENAVHGGWVAEIIKYFRDSFQYNIAAAEVSWENRATYGIKQTPDNAAGFTTNSYNWSGNALRHLDMYNTTWDTRVQPHEVSTKGEYAAYIECISRVALNTLLRELPESGKLPNDVRARESNAASNRYYVPDINPEFFTDLGLKGDIDWLQIAGLSDGATAAASNKFRFSDSYEKFTVYGRICPADLGITNTDSPNTPQIWKFITINNDVLIYAERMTNMHNRIPILLCQAKEFGKGLQTRSTAEDLVPIQSCVTSLINSAIQGRRRAVADRAIYNPRLIDSAHLMEDSAVAKIPLRPSATLNTVPSQAYFPIPFNDSLASSLSELPLFASFADQITGQNPVRSGQFVKGNKTKQEFDTVMGNANGRDQVMAMHFEARFFTPLKEIVLANIVQFQKPRAVPSVDRKRSLAINPESIRNAALTFKISDGLIPSDKLMDTESTAVAFQTLQALPSLAAEYNVGDIFAYLMHLRGAEIDEFRKSQEQRNYEQALQQWSQLAQFAMEKQQQFSIPQPKPQDYGVKPDEPSGTNPGDDGGTPPEGVQE